jgi:hypothetical protein
LRRAWLFLVTGFYYTALYTFWTLLTRQDYLPFYPLAMVFLAAILLTAARRISPVGPSWILAAVGVLEIVLLLAGRPLSVDGTQREREILGEFLRLTRPGEDVMDFKGESVFRKRAFFYVLEPLTFVRMRRKQIPDNVAERLVQTDTRVVLNQDRWYPKDAAKFMAANYLAVGRVRVAGKVIADGVTTDAPVRFEVAIPAAYLICADAQPVAGTLDGKLLSGPRELAVGPHVFTSASPHGRLAIIWSRAVDEGFQPLPDQPGWQDYR